MGAALPAPLMRAALLVNLAAVLCLYGYLLEKRLALEPLRAALTRRQREAL